LSPSAATLFEVLEDAGLTTAAINITCYRGRTPHYPTLPAIPIPAYGPKQFFYYNLFESERTGAPLAVFARGAGSIDGYAASVDVTLYRDGGEVYVRRDGEEARLVPGEAVDLLDDVPDGVERAWSAMQNPNAGDVVVTAAPGFEFADLAGRHHLGGGSHGSL